MHFHDFMAKSDAVTTMQFSSSNWPCRGGVEGGVEKRGRGRGKRGPERGGPITNLLPHASLRSEASAVRRERGGARNSGRLCFTYFSYTILILTHGRSYIAMQGGGCPKTPPNTPRTPQGVCENPNPPTPIIFES